MKSVSETVRCLWMMYSVLRQVLELFDIIARR